MRSRSCRAGGRILRALVARSQDGIAQQHTPSSTPSAIWGPVLGVLLSSQGMAEAIGGKDTAATALALFDRLRLREPLARAFSGGGEITEDGWRAAARVRLAFLVQTLCPPSP